MFVLRELRELVEIWIRARAIVVLGIRLIPYCLGFYLAHAFISHLIASLLITLVCFSNGWHKELSPSAFREWKGPRESVLASALSVLLLYLLYRFWPQKLGESPLAHAHPPAIPTQSAPPPPYTFTQSLKPPPSGPISFEFTLSRDSAASFGTLTTNGPSTPRQTGATENTLRPKAPIAGRGQMLAHKPESSKDHAEGPCPEDVQLPGDSSTVHVLPHDQATQEQESAIGLPLRPSQLFASLSRRDAPAGPQASPKTPSPPASLSGGGPVQTSQQHPPTEYLDRPENQNPETTLDGEVAGSVEVNPDATSMLLKLEPEFPNVRDYPMVEPDTSKAEMDRRRDEVEKYCEEGDGVEETTSKFPLFNSLEYYQLNRLTLWVAKNLHMQDSRRRFPPDYPRQADATEEDVSQQGE